MEALNLYFGSKCLRWKFCAVSALTISSSATCGCGTIRATQQMMPANKLEAQFQSSPGL